MLKSPLEDFSRTTLAALPGTLRKLQYVAGLRQRNGDYFHWGMSRIHGEETANVTIAQAHSDVFSHLLRTPISSLWEEMRSDSGNPEESDAGRVTEALAGQKQALLPADLKGGSKRHFNSVLLALSSLATSSGL